MNSISLFSYPYDAHLKDPPVDHVLKYWRGRMGGDIFLLFFLPLLYALIPMENIKDYDTCF